VFGLVFAASVEHATFGHRLDQTVVGLVTSGSVAGVVVAVTAGTLGTFAGSGLRRLAERRRRAVEPDPVVLSRFAVGQDRRRAARHLLAGWLCAVGLAVILLTLYQFGGDVSNHLFALGWTVAFVAAGVQGFRNDGILVSWAVASVIVLAVSVPSLADIGSSGRFVATLFDQVVLGMLLAAFAFPLALVARRLDVWFSENSGSIVDPVRERVDDRVATGLMVVLLLLGTLGVGAAVAPTSAGPGTVTSHQGNHNHQPDKRTSRLSPTGKSARQRDARILVR